MARNAKNPDKLRKINHSEELLRSSFVTILNNELATIMYDTCETNGNGRSFLENRILKKKPNVLRFDSRTNKRIGLKLENPIQFPKNRGWNPELEILKNQFLIKIQGTLLIDHNEEEEKEEETKQREHYQAIANYFARSNIEEDDLQLIVWLENDQGDVIHIFFNKNVTMQWNTYWNAQGDGHACELFGIGSKEELIPLYQNKFKGKEEFKMMTMLCRGGRSVYHSNGNKRIIWYASIRKVEPKNKEPTIQPHKKRTRTPTKDDLEDQRPTKKIKDDQEDQKKNQTSIVKMSHQCPTSARNKHEVHGFKYSQFSDISFSNHVNTHQHWDGNYHKEAPQQVAMGSIIHDNTPLHRNIHHKESPQQAKNDQTMGSFNHDNTSSHRNSHRKEKVESNDDVSSESERENWSSYDFIKGEDPQEKLDFMQDNEDNDNDDEPQDEDEEHSSAFDFIYAEGDSISDENEDQGESALDFMKEENVEDSKSQEFSNVNHGIDVNDEKPMTPEEKLDATRNRSVDLPVGGCGEYPQQAKNDQTMGSFNHDNMPSQGYHFEPDFPSICSEVASSNKLFSEKYDIVFYGTNPTYVLIL